MRGGLGNRWKKRLSLIPALTLASAAFLLLLPLSGYLVYIALVPLVALGVFTRTPDGLIVGLLMAIAMLLAYLQARFVFMRLRWRFVEPRYCIECEYDLTGNTSGVCPECGTLTVLP
jgi:hypothetical protein